MAYNFNWDKLTKDDWDLFYWLTKDGEEYSDDFIGCVRVGNLCFDLITRQYDENEGPVLTFDLYVGGVEDHYAYSRILPDYPYAYAEGSDFGKLLPAEYYEDFKQKAEAMFTDYIENSTYTKKFGLMQEASRPLHIW